MNIRLLVIDIDGTLAGQSNKISETVQQAVKTAMAQGIQVALATGRMYCSALRFYNCIGSELPLLAYNGAWIQHPKTGEIYQHFPLSLSLTWQLLEYFQKPELQDHLGVHCYLDDQLYVKEITSETENYCQRSGVKPIAVGDWRVILERSPTKILAMSNNPKVIKYLLEFVPQNFSQDELHFTQSTETFFEATHPLANKGTAIRYLAEELLGLTASQVMAIGDNFNDTEMLQYAGLSVAMGNAPAEIQNLASWVAPDVEKDGVAVAIKKFLL